MARISNWERAQLLVQCRDRRALQTFLKAWVTTLREQPARQLRWHLDVDPLDF
jgi:primosomal protein N'